MSKIRNTPHVYTLSTKHLGIQWYPGNAEGFHSPPLMLSLAELRAAIASDRQARA